MEERLVRLEARLAELESTVTELEARIAAVGERPAPEIVQAEAASLVPELGAASIQFQLIRAF